jgi:sulfatase modifying factor 1
MWYTNLRSSTLGFMVLASVCAATSAEVVIETLTVGNPGNAGEWAGGSYGGYGEDRICGAVVYVYEIGNFEITAGQYTEFLNAVATSDTYGLWNEGMVIWTEGCQIQRNGTFDNYSYSVDPN